MLACLHTAALVGVEAVPVQVEVDVSFGLPSMTMVGLPDASVRESRDRVRSAIRNSGFDFPDQRITVNLAPADVRKAGTAFDLPIALGVLVAAGLTGSRPPADVVLVGELSLDGGILATRGVLPVAVSARRHGRRVLLVPRVNAGEAAVVEGLKVLPVATLREAAEALVEPDAVMPAPPPPAAAPPADDPDLSDLRGQALGRRALEIAAAGGHNLLLVGPPGSGKTMLARRLPGILPPLTLDEALETTAIHSVAGVLPPGTPLLSRRPFRAPHHTASPAALVGGGTGPRPGEISLAHHGVLFLDEVAEFDRRVLEVLRQPLEEGVLAIARVARTAIFPARVTLVAAMNPCPCGFLGDERRACRCPAPAVARYAARLSGPLRDRIDLTVPVPALTPAELAATPDGEPSGPVRERVVEARARQRRRTGTAFIANSRLDGRALQRWCPLDAEASRLLSRAAGTLALSGRGWDRVLRVARTCADLAGRDRLSASDVAEALHFRLDPVSEGRGEASPDLRRALDPRFR